MHFYPSKYCNNLGFTSNESKHVKIDSIASSRDARKILNHKKEKAKKNVRVIFLLYAHTPLIGDRFEFQHKG